MGGISRREQIVAAAARLFGENGFDIAAITEGHVAVKPEPTIAGFTVDLTLDMESIGRHVRLPARSGGVLQGHPGAPAAAAESR
jgi:hypothetical protein